MSPLNSDFKVVYLKMKKEFVIYLSKVIMVKQQAVGKIVRDNIDFLKKLSKTRSLKKKEYLLNNATNQQLLCLVEIALNVTKSRFILRNKQKQKLLPYANTIRNLSRARTPKAAKNVLQIGNGLPFLHLLVPIITAASALLNNGN